MGLTHLGKLLVVTKEGFHPTPCQQSTESIRHGPKPGSHEAEAFTKLESEAKAKALTLINLEAEAEALDYEAEARLFVLNSKWNRYSSYQTPSLTYDLYFTKTREFHENFESQPLPDVNLNQED